jgi:hypothetical protein
LGSLFAYINYFTIFNNLVTCRHLLNNICGVVGNNGKICTRASRCPAHNDPQRREVRRLAVEKQHFVVLERYRVNYPENSVSTPLALAGTQTLPENRFFFGDKGVQ